MKAKRGRPRLPAEEKKQVFAVRLTPEERSMIERAADASGLTVSEWSRRELIAAASKSA